MRFNKRESRLAVIALVAVLVGVTWWWAEPRYEQWKLNNEEVEMLLQRKAMAQHLLEQTDELNERLATLRQALPQHPHDADVTSRLLRNLQEFADRHHFLLLRREPEGERQIGDLYEQSITCTWEGELAALVHFLYALQAQGAIVDVRQLNVSPVQGDPNRLRGTMMVDYAYSRTRTGS